MQALGFALAAAGLWVGSSAAIAQNAAMAQPAPRLAAYAQVGKSCVAETRRFCPGIDPATPQGRNQVICLRPYRTSLSLSCRRAVNAVPR